MTDIKSLKEAFVEFIEKLIPSIQDPMSITQQKCQMLIKLLKEDGKTITDVVLFITNLKIGITQPSLQKLKDEDVKKSISKTKQQDHGLFQPESYFKLNLPNKDLIIKQSSHKNIKVESPNHGIQKQQEEDASTPMRLGIDKIKQTPKQNHSFNMFFEQVKGFSIIAKEFLLDDLSQSIKEFRNHTKIMGCIEQKTFEVNSGEITETDKKLHNQNYGFTTYSKQVERQKSFKKMSIFEQKKKEDSINEIQNNQQLVDKQEKQEIIQQKTATYNPPRPSLYSIRAQQRVQQQQALQQQREQALQEKQQEKNQAQIIKETETNQPQVPEKIKLDGISTNNTSPIGTVAPCISLPVSPANQDTIMDQPLQSPKLETNTYRPSYTRYQYTSRNYRNQIEKPLIDMKQIDQNF